MKKMTFEELLALSPGTDPDDLTAGQDLADRLKAAGLEGSRYILATPQTGRFRRIHPAGRGERKARDLHGHTLRRH